MASTNYEFGRALRALFRYARLLSYGLIFLMLYWAAREMIDGYRFFAGFHVALGIAFLVAIALLLGWFIGRPVYRFLKIPRTLRPPDLPEPEARSPADLSRHLAFVERYVSGLLVNPEWSGSPSDVQSVIAECRTLEAEAQSAGNEGLAALNDRLEALEHERVARLLAPLDEKVGAEIRAEAVRVGIATAVSPYGNLDAFLVLWRNCNLVARIARIYYGRPGARGTLRVLRDVSAATMAGAYLENLTDIAGDAVASFAGKAAGVIAGPLLDGSLNAVATLRVGYLTKARCRAFSAWTEQRRTRAVANALKEAAGFSKSVVSDLVRTVGGGLLSIPARALGRMIDGVASLFRRPEEPEEGSAPA
ncbi:MAG: YcjF family protein [Planctomycetota bacterium]|jgi:hypothetical protein